MRTTKKIIIRIIVAVSVAFILSKLKLLGIISVNAAENVVKAPQNIITYDYSNNSFSNSLVQTTLMNSTYYVNSFNTNYSQVNGFSFAMTKGAILPGFLWDASFIFVQSGLSSEQFSPVRAYIRDTNDNITYCQVSSSGVENSSNNPSGSLWSTFSSFNTISCKNVYIDSDFRIYITGDFSVSSGDVVGISRVNFVKVDGSNQYLQQIEQQTKETNDIIKNNDTTEAKSKADSFFDGFESTSMGGVSDIITSPFRLLNYIINYQCTPLRFQLPFVHDEVELRCMKGIYQEYFGIFFTLWQMITTGLISYNVAINLYSKIKNMQNPKNDKIEVLNL